MTDAYAHFLARKAVAIPARGLATLPALAAHLYPFQRDCVTFGLRRGAWACFLNTGLGKTAIELEWCKHAAAATNGRALILTPLAVARQIEREGQRWGYAIRVIREQAEAGEGINVCNYDRLDHLDPAGFGAVALDESSILKNMMGAMSRALIAFCAGHRFRLCATATPAPNDHMELGQHAECLGIMPAADMLVRWFTHDSGDTKTWRLKGHAVASFWDWVASWARMAHHPRDLGDDRAGFDLPPLEIVRHHVRTPLRTPGALFAMAAVSATELHAVKRQTVAVRAAETRRTVYAERGERWIIWVDTDYEATAVLAALADLGPSVREVRGTHSVAQKEDTLAAFDADAVRVLITKPSVCGFGLNWQHTARQCFVGRSFSYERWYQAVRRSWRFGQQRPVVVHLIVDAGEDAIGRVLDRKGAEHEQMASAMRHAMRRRAQRPAAPRPMPALAHGHAPAWL